MIHDQLKAHRTSRGYMLSELSAMTGLSVSYLSDLERGRTNPSLKTIERIASAYHLPVSEFLGTINYELKVNEQLMLKAYRDGNLEVMLRLALARADELEADE